MGHRLARRYRVSHLARLGDRYPDLPPAALLKIDLLRLGVRFVQEVGTRHYHHHDERGQKPQVAERAHLQGSIQLPEGPHVFVAHSDESPYLLRGSGSQMRLSVDARGDGHEEALCEVTPGPDFHWASSRTSHGTPMGTIFTPSLGGACGPIAAFLLRHCEFVVDNEECRFCSWVRMGKSFEMRPNVAEMRETLLAIQGEQRSIGYLAFSGGSLFNRTREADAFLAYMDAARQTEVPLPPTVAAIQAQDRPDSERLRAAGFDYACYSMEVWDNASWQAVLPGKSRSVGRARWMACLEEAVDVFGPGRVLSNFVAGIETAVDGAFASPEAAAESTLEGFRWCYERGIYPKYAVWIRGGGAGFGSKAPAPIEYYARLALGRQQMYDEWPLPVPESDCARCLTQSIEGDLALLDPERHGRGAAAPDAWQRHPAAATAG